jgi:ketosteroid isomerase-like protein
MGKSLAVLFASLSLLTAAAEDDIRRVLEDQVAAWNRGDVRAFMQGYDNSPATTFVGAKVTKGHAQVLADYLQRYPTKEKMGTLEFSGLEIHPLDGEYASVIGRWHLTRSKEAGGDAGGIFTLLFRKTAAGWKIILDHTSSAHLN